MDHWEQESEDRGLPLQRVLTDTGDRAAALIGLGVGVVILAVLGAVAVIVGGDAGWWLYSALGAIAAVVGYLTYRRLRVWAGWGNPELFLPSSEDLALGDRVIARFRRVARRGTDPSGLAVTGRIVVEEVTRRLDRDGERSHDHVEVVHDAPVDVVLTTVVGRTVEADLGLEIPLADVPPSLDLPANVVRWRLIVRIEAPNAPDDDSTFPLVVAPAVAQRLQSGGVGR